MLWAELEGDLKEALFKTTFTCLPYLHESVSSLDSNSMLF